MTINVIYSILVDFSPTFYCLPKPLFLYGSMVLLSILLLVLSFQLCTSRVVMLGHDWWQCMVIYIISVQYNGGFLLDMILLTQGYYHRGTRLNAM